MCVCPMDPNAVWEGTRHPLNHSPVVLPKKLRLDFVGDPPSMERFTDRGGAPQQSEIALGLQAPAIDFLDLWGKCWYPWGKMLISSGKVLINNDQLVHTWSIYGWCLFGFPEKSGNVPSKDERGRKSPSISAFLFGTGNQLVSGL